ncbi:hypothetical protein JB92DRAFT_2831655 [Gautieria morchelliformis]|nr:hypothetical protein JB92DRAFT_2831655 [Gautieria morchelliformis]
MYGVHERKPSNLCFHARWIANEQANHMSHLLPINWSSAGIDAADIFILKMQMTETPRLIVNQRFLTMVIALSKKLSLSEILLQCPYTYPMCQCFAIHDSHSHPHLGDSGAGAGQMQPSHRGCPRIGPSQCPRVIHLHQCIIRRTPKLGILHISDRERF